MVLARHRHLHINMARMKLRFRSLIIDLCRNHGLTIVLEMRSEDGGVLNVVVEGDSFNDSVDVGVRVVVSRADDGDQDSVAGGLDGRITINLSVFVMPVYKSSRNGSCLRKSNSTDCPSCL